MTVGTLHPLIGAPSGGGKRIVASSAAVTLRPSWLKPPYLKARRQDQGPPFAGRLGEPAVRSPFWSSGSTVKGFADHYG